MVVCHRLADDRTGRVPGISNYLFPLQTRHRRQQPECLFATPASGGALRPERSETRPAVAGSKDSSGGIEPCRRRRRRYQRLDRYLVLAPRGSELCGEDRRGWVSFDLMLAETQAALING